ncbi:MAG: glycosyltransferase family 39 protein [Verrucomicrobiota bacterium]
MIACSLLLGVPTVFVATDLGVGLSPDSVKYITVARNLLSGHGFSVNDIDGGYKPATHYPPLYPATLAGFGGLSSSDPMVVARRLNALFSVLNLFLVGFWVRRGLPESWAGPLIALFVFWASAAHLTTHTMAWSEPMFLFFGMTGLYLLLNYAERSEIPRLIGAGLLLSLSALTRYPGLFFMAAGGLFMLMQTKHSFKRRVIDATVYSAACLAPFVLWMIRNKLVAETATSRVLAFHPVTQTRLAEGFREIANWVLPWKFASVWLGAVLIVCAFILCRPSRKQPMHQLLFLTATVYLAGLLTSMTLFDAHTTLRSRILSPVYIALLIGATITLTRAASRHRGFRLGLLAFLVLWIPFNGYRCLKWVLKTHEQGQGYSGKIWSASPLMALVRKLPEDHTIASNAPDAITMLARRRAGSVPIKFKPNSAMEVDGYEEILREWHQSMPAKKGLIVWFDRVDWRFYLPSKDEVAASPLITARTNVSDGTIFAYRAGEDVEDQ